MNLSQSQIKLIRSLGQKKFRQKYQYFIVEGSKIALDALRSSYDVVNIYGLPSWTEKYSNELSKYKDRITTISSKQLKQISYLNTPNQVLMVLRIPQGSENLINTTKGLHFYTDGIQNPGNLGTIIRIADWFGFESVIASETTVDFYNEKTIQATMGAFTNIKLLKANLVDLPHIDQSNVITTSLKGLSIYKIDVPDHGIIVIGNEGAGISDVIFELSTMSVCIPAHPKSTADSLNAAVSAGILASIFRGSS